MTPLQEEDAAAQLAAEIYGTAVEPSSWPSVIEKTTRFIGGAAGWIMVQDCVGHAGEFLHSFADGDAPVALFRSIQWIDPIFGVLPSLANEEIVSTSGILTRCELRNTRYYQEWMEPQGWVDNVYAMLDRSPSKFTVLMIACGNAEGWADHGVRRRTALITPHLRRSLVIGKALGLKTMQAATLADTVDRISAGVFFVDADGWIIQSNERGSRMLAEGVLPVTFATGALLKRVAPPPSTTESAPNHSDAAWDYTDAVLPVNAPNGERYVVHGLPLNQGRRPQTGGYQYPVAALFVQKAAIGGVSVGAAIAKHYKLTPAELRVLLAIAQKSGAPAVALALGLSVSTVRTHLLRLFSKTGTSSQSALAALVAKFSSLF